MKKKKDIYNAGNDYDQSIIIVPSGGGGGGGGGGGQCDCVEMTVAEVNDLIEALGEL